MAATIFNDNAIAQFAARNHSTAIEGQVFIVTKNGDSLKLGDVQVSIMERPGFDKTLVESSRRLSHYFGNLLKQKLKKVLR